MRSSGGNGEFLTPAPEWVSQRGSLLPWSGLLLGKLTLVVLSTRLEDTQGVRKVSLMWGAEWKGTVDGGNPFSRSSLCRPGKWWGSPCFFGLAPHLDTGLYVLVHEPG